jgi:RNA polymerase sigma factor (TIGR02999 family)
MNLPGRPCKRPHWSTRLIYLRLVGDNRCRGFDSRGHFFAAAAEAMRRILVDRARDRRRQRRGGGHRRVRIDLEAIPIVPPGDDLLALDEALKSLALEDPIGAELVGLRAFAGLTLAEAAEVLGIGRRTADRYWAYARAWLCDALSGDPGPEFLIPERIRHRLAQRGEKRSID